VTQAFRRALVEVHSEPWFSALPHTGCLQYVKVLMLETDFVGWFWSWASYWFLPGT
jgi:hypothetical protein